MQVRLRLSPSAQPSGSFILCNAELFTAFYRPRVTEPGIHDELYMSFTSKWCWNVKRRSELQFWSFQSSNQMKSLLNAVSTMPMQCPPGQLLFKFKIFFTLQICLCLVPSWWRQEHCDRATGLTGLNADFPAHNVRKMQSRPNLVSLLLTTWTFKAFFA